MFINTVMCLTLEAVHLVAMQTEAEYNGMYVDLSFPADDSSLFSDYTTPLSSLLGEITWLRPQVILIFCRGNLYKCM